MLSWILASVQNCIFYFLPATSTILPTAWRVLHFNRIKNCHTNTDFVGLAQFPLFHVCFFVILPTISAK